MYTNICAGEHYDSLWIDSDCDSVQIFVKASQEDN